MPIVSTFFGIVIRMFYQEHGVPHFHAEYQGQQVTFTFDGNLLAGALRSRTALRLIEEWAKPSLELHFALHDVMTAPASSPSTTGPCPSSPACLASLQSPPRS